MGENMKALGWTAAAAILLILTGCADNVPTGNPTPNTLEATPSSAVPTDSPTPSAQASESPLQVVTIPLGRQKQSGVEARLPINGYSGPPGSEITFDASESVGVVVKYEWDLDGDGSYDRTTSDPVLKHTYRAEFDGLMILRKLIPEIFHSTTLPRGYDIFTKVVPARVCVRFVGS